jgi:hypothetical protein
MLDVMARPPGSRADPPPGDRSASAPHRPGADEYTLRMPQMLVQPSSGFDVSALSPAGDEGGPTQPTIARPRLIVFEETSLGLADAFARMGFLVRAATTGVEVLSMCNEQPPAAVVVGPGDPERRRVLTSALRLRFGGVGVVYVVPAGESVRGDGVHAVLPWPLPTTAEVMRAIPWHAPPSAPVTRVVPPSAGLPFRSRSHTPELSADASETGPVDLLALPPPPPPDEDAPATLLSVRAALSVAEPTASGPTSGSDVWRDAAPLLLRLEAAARFLEALAGRDPAAAAHADTVRAAARGLAQQQGDDER